MEEWKEIPNTNGQYYISNLGNVKSYKKGNIRLLKTRKNRSGNTIVRLHIEDKIKDVLINKLIKELFPRQIKQSPYKQTYLLKKDTRDVELKDLTLPKGRRVEILLRFNSNFFNKEVCVIQDFIDEKQLIVEYYDLEKEEIL